MQTTSDQELASHLRLVLARSVRRLRRESSPGDLGPSLIAALSSVERFGPLTPSELAAREGVQRPTATRMIGRLEELGYVQRSADPDDGRSSLLAITAEGRALLATIRERKDAFLALRLAELDAAERALLERAAGILERMLVEPAP